MKPLKRLQSFSATAKNVEAITEPLGRRSEELVVAVLRSLANVDNALIQLDTFGEAVNTSDGTIRRLARRRRTLLRVPPNPREHRSGHSSRSDQFLDDVRVFTDKIARDPRQLGVRGALGNRPTGAGLK